MVFIIAFSGISCKKEHLNAASLNASRLFVRIQQVDKDGSIYTSEMVKVNVD